MKVKAVYTNKAPGGVAYRCSFRITEAVYLVERMVKALALEMGVDQIDLRMRSFIGPDQFPYETTTGWTYDSGNYAETMRVAMDIAGYDDLRREQAEKRARGELMGIGVSFFTEGVGAGPRKHMDILGLAMNDGADLRVHPSGKAVVSPQRPDPGPGPRDDVRADRRRGARASRPRTSRSATATPTSRPTGWAPTARARRRCRGARGRGRLAQGPRQGARDRGDDARDPPRGPRLGEGPLVRQGRPREGRARSRTSPTAPTAASAMPEGMEGGLDAQVIYDPPNLTYPYGAYIAVVDIDPETGARQGPAVHRGRRLRRADQPDDRRRADPRRPGRGRSASR